MIQFSAETLNFGAMGEKTGLTCILLTAAQAQIPSPKNKSWFCRIKPEIK